MTAIHAGQHDDACPACDDISPCPSCSTDEVCQQTYPASCDTCPVNVCVPSRANPPVGTLVGGISGGCIGALLLVGGLFLLYRRIRKTMPIPRSRTQEEDNLPLSMLGSATPSENGSDFQETTYTMHVYRDPGLGYGTGVSRRARDLWRISEQFEPPETPPTKLSSQESSMEQVPTIVPSCQPSSDTPPDAYHVPSVTNATPPQVDEMRPQTAASQSSAARFVTPLPGHTSCDSTLYAFFNELVDDYEDQSDYGSLESGPTPTQAPPTRAMHGRQDIRKLALPARMPRNKNPLDVAQKPSQLRARPNHTPPVPTPSSQLDDRFSESVQMAAEGHMR